jgi:hypothetical protein
MDRRTVWAILLMMVIAIVPAIFIKRPSRPAPGATTPDTGSAAVPPAAPGAARAPDTLRAALDSTRRDTTAPGAAPAPAARADTVRVTSPLYTYGVSTAGGRLVEAPHHQ